MTLPPDEPNEEEKLEEEPNDIDTPFSLPDERKADIEDAKKRRKHKRPELESTHPMTDSDLDETDLYNEGVAGAAGVGEPNADDAVVAYHSPKYRKGTTRRRSK